MSQFSQWQSQRDSSQSQRDSQMPPSSPSVQHSQQPPQSPAFQSQSQPQPQSQAQQPLSDHSITSSSIAGELDNSVASLNNTQEQVKEDEPNPPQRGQDAANHAENEPNANADADADDDRDSVLDD